MRYHPLFITFLLLVLFPVTSPCQSTRPNVILMMADDLGWGDVGYNGHKHIRTPNLDDMARTGLRFDRFYAAAPVCSPTRASCLTGRHPYRIGIKTANGGHMLPRELTLTELLKREGYLTGHFGKWHLGTLTRTEKDSNRGGPRGAMHFAPPWVNGFDACFSTEAKVPTYNPMLDPQTGKPYGTAYWQEDGTRVKANLEGDDSRIIMDRAIPFVDRAAREKKPFFMVVWFHAPHLPVVAGPEHRKLYADLPAGLQHYYGCISALDDQVGRLRKHLREKGLAENTMLWFCSDNGPEGKTGPGSAGPFRGRKRDLYEGGVRVAGLLEWPAKITSPRATSVPCCTSDYVPTVVDILGLKPKDQPQPLDGVSLKPLLDGTMTERPQPIGFQSANKLSLVDNRYKIIRTGQPGYALYDLLNDPGEKNDVSKQHPEVVDRMRKVVEDWQKSCADSAVSTE